MKHMPNGSEPPTGSSSRRRSATTTTSPTRTLRGASLATRASSTARISGAGSARVPVAIADRNATEGGPPLRALCVSSGDETVGAGYAYALKIMGQPKPKDLQPHAAESRLQCYRFHGADMPADGGQLTPTRAVIAKRVRTKPHVGKPVILGPVHFSQLPLSGQCDPCD